MKATKRFLLQTILLIATIAVPFKAIGQDDTWKRENDRGNRYEGLLNFPTGNPDLEFLSFFGYNEPFGSDVNLKVRFFLPSDSDVSIIARELEPILQYWMESKPCRWRGNAWNEFYPWPTEILIKEGISHSNLGVLVSSSGGPGGARQYLPAIVYHSNLPPSIDQYSLYMRPNRTLSHVKFTLYRTEKKQVEEHHWSKDDEKGADEPFPVIWSMKKRPEGLRKLAIQGRIKDSPKETLSYEFWFYHKP